MTEENRDRWERVGRHLLVKEFEVLSEITLRQAFLNAKRRIQAGEELTEDDITEMRQAIEEAKEVVEIAASASPESSPAPSPFDFIDDQQREEYIREADTERTPE